MAITNTPLLGLPYAGADTDETYAVLARLFVKDGQKLTLPEIVEKYTPTIGTVYIKAADWTAADGTADAYDAKITISGVDYNSMILLYPATDYDADKAKSLGIRAKAASGVPNDDTFVIVRATGGDPTVTEGISLVYIALQGYAVWSAGLTPPALPYATVIGVDPYIATEEGDRDDIAASQRLVTETVTALRSTLSTLSTGLADTNKALELRLKSADLPTKLDEYRAAKGLIDKTVSDLVNYYAKDQTLTKDEINALVSAIPKFKIEVVTSLPTSNISDTTVYLVKSGDDDTNLYTEYIRTNNKWEKLGTQTVDLTGYATEAWVNDVLASYVKTVDMEAYVAGLLKSYMTKEDAAKTYQPAGDYPTADEMDEAISNATKDLAPKSLIPTKVSQLTNDSDYLNTTTGDQRYAKPTDIPTIPTKLPNPYPLTINGQTYDGSKTVSVTVDGSGEETPSIVLPSKLYAVAGHEFVLYYRNILKAMRPDDFVVSASISSSAITNLKPLYRDKIMFTPTEALVGQHTITILVKSRRTWADVAQKSVTLVISADRTFTGKQVMYIGDSLTFAGVYAKEVQDMSGGGIASVGTVTAKSVPTEGRNGAASYDYLIKDTIQGAHNPFYNPDQSYALELDDKYIVDGQNGVSSTIPMDNSGDKTVITHHFDFAYYMANHGATVGELDAVFINLGNNGGIRSNYKTVHMGFLAMVDRIRAYDLDLPIFIHLFIPKSDAGSIERNLSGQFDGLLNDRSWYYQIVQYYIDKWDNDPRVSLVPTYTMVDTYHDFKLQTVPVSARNSIEVTIGDNDGVHPATPGYLHMADSYYNFLQAYWSGEPIDTYYTVTNNLTNVTNSNTATTVKQGNAYTATLTAASGYTLDTVTVTMGGESVSVSGGTINISSVTGDIVITATATEDEEEPTVVNLVDPSTANDASPNTTLFADEWVNNYRLSGSKVASGTISSNSGSFVSDLIPVTKTTKLRIEGLDYSTTAKSNYTSIVFFESDGMVRSGKIYGMSEITDNAVVDQDLLANGVILLTVGGISDMPSYTNLTYARICGYAKDGNNANVIVTAE